MESKQERMVVAHSTYEIAEAYTSRLGRVPYANGYSIEETLLGNAFKLEQRTGGNVWTGSKGGPPIIVGPKTDGAWEFLAAGCPNTCGADAGCHCGAQVN